MNEYSRSCINFHEVRNVKPKQLWKALLASGAMLILILDSQTAVEGAKTGIDLCIRTVIPSLFPFFIISSILTSSLSGQSLFFLKPLGRLYGIPAGAESLLLIGFLGGYPVGAQAVSSAYNSGSLTKSQAERMLAFCNNAGPAFLFGVVSQFFPSAVIPWVLWMIHLAGALMVAILIPHEPAQAATLPPAKEPSLTQAMQQSLRTMAAVCGWVILFRVLIGFFYRWFLWILPVELQVLIIGCLELSNGCMELAGVADLPTRFLLCSGMLAFGGLCVTMQTLSVVKGLSVKHYLLGKLMQTIAAVSICIGILYHNWVILIVFLLFFFFLFRKGKNSRFYRLHPV